MKLRILTICFLVSIHARGQETILKEKKGESYYVLKSSPKIKHGTYQFSTKKGVLEKGQYDNDKKIGVWEYYDGDGNLEQKYDYTTNQLLFNNEGDKRYSPFGSYKIVIDGKATDTEPDTPPVFIGGRTKYKRLIETNLKYPNSKEIEGRQFVQFTLSTQGNILNPSNYRYVLSDDILKEAIRLVNLLTKEWIPAKHQGKEVDCSMIASIEFRLK